MKYQKFKSIITLFLGSRCYVTTLTLPQHQMMEQSNCGNVTNWKAEVVEIDPNRLLTLKVNLEFSNRPSALIGKSGFFKQTLNIDR